MPIEINSSSANNQARGLRDYSFSIPGFEPKVTIQDRLFFTEQLSLLLDTGGELFNSLQVLRQQMLNSPLSRVVDDLLHSLEQGKALSAALEAHPKIFPQTYVKLVEASEQGGFLVEVLQELSVMDAKRQQLRSTISSALMYPVFLLLFSFAVVGFVLVVVFPKFADIFVSIYDQLPATTKFLMATSDVMRDHWQSLLAGFALWLTIILFAFRQPGGKRLLDRWKLHLPLIRGIYQQIYMVHFLRVLSLSLSNGVTLIDALTACREVVDNSYFLDFTREIEESVQQGQGLSAAVNKADFVPSLAKHMLQTGEQSGSLAKVTSRMADHYEKELMHTLQTVSKMSEPVMLIVMGAVVGILVSSLILPIFKMSSAAM